MQLTHKAGVPLFFVMVSVLCALELWVVSSPGFLANSAILGPVITIDLLLGIPLLFYGLVARPRRLSPLTVAPIFLLAVLIAGSILPPGGRAYLDMAALLAALVEVALLGLGVWKARSIYQRYRQARRQSAPFIDALESSVYATLGDNLVIRLIVTELSLTFLALFGWFMQFRAADPQHHAFTYHRRSRYPMIFTVFLLLITLETIGLHLLIQHWSPPIAWVLTILSIYSILWMLGDFNALRLHPVVLAGDTLHLRSGLRWGVSIKLSEIAEIQAPRRSDDQARDYLSFARIDEAQIVLVLRHPVAVRGLFGRQRQAARIGLFLDDTRAFRAALEQHVGPSTRC